MRLVGLVLLITCAAGVATSAQDFSVFEKREFTSSTGYLLPYRILFPENYSSGTNYPVVLFLHGAGERGNDNEKQLVHGARLFIDSLNRKKFPAIVIFPQCSVDQYWASVNIDRTSSPFVLDFDYFRPATGSLLATMELLSTIIRNEKVNSSRIYITGLSMGGMGTFEAVYRYPEVFAAALPICGGGDVSRYDERIAKIPFWIFHGDVDGVVSVQHSREMIQKLKKLKATAKYTEYAGVNHNSWDNALAEPEFLRWMFQHKAKHKKGQ
jgi:predicted peptidase